ncbi:MAG TPA: hypothetical protein VEY90_03940 [Thermoleophilaceae bacterium]|nr:hypothetical protein [Thermoleophilaceae bacterium]
MPTAYAGNPRSPVGRTCGTSVTQVRPSSSAASAAATVRMSATTSSGSTERISSRVGADAFTAAS